MENFQMATCSYPSVYVSDVFQKVDVRMKFRT